jgi:ankyrin repeat protein
LIWSDWTFYLDELVDAVAINVNEDPAFKPKNRMPVPRDVLTLCSSLVVVSRHESSTDMDTARLAHFSVKEYLVSNHVSKTFESLSCEKVARSNLARLCLTYLIGVSQLTVEDRPVISLGAVKIDFEFPFAQYSARYWRVHACGVESEDEDLCKMVLSFFLEKHKAFSLFKKFVERPDSQRNCPLSYAAGTGLTRTVENLLDRGADINAKDSAALRAALHNRQYATVQLLLQRGARVDTENNEVFSEAILLCDNTTIQSLLDRSVMTAAGNETLMSLAVKYDREWIVQWLLERDADVNAWSLSSSTLSTFASLQLLLDRGADVNAGAGRLLREASRNGLHDLVQLLLRIGADPEAHSQSTPTALQEVLEKAYGTLVFYLSTGDSRDTVLESPDFAAYYKIAQLLIEKGANIDFPGGEWLETLRTGGWSVQIIQQILEKNVPLRHDHILSAMYDRDPQAEAIVSVMLPYLTFEQAVEDFTGRKNLLHKAAEYGSEDIVQRCLDLGADVHAEDEHYKTALHYAAEYGHLVVVKMLVKAGSDIEALDCKKFTPLAYAQDDVWYAYISGKMEARNKRFSRHEIAGYLSDLHKAQRVRLIRRYLRTTRRSIENRRQLEFPNAHRFLRNLANHDLPVRVQKPTRNHLLP